MQAESIDAGTVADRLDEVTLVSRAQDGDLRSFEQLVTLYEGPLFRLAVRMVGDRHEAEDILQETLVAVWRGLPDLGDPVAFPRWIYQVATRRCLNLLRTRDRRPVRPTTDADLESAADHAGVQPDGLTEQRAAAESLAGLLRDLPADQRACWLLHTFHDLTYAEIAEIMAVGDATVRGRIARARKTLAEGMLPWR